VTLLLGSLGVSQSYALLGQWWPLFVVIAGLVIFLNDTKSYLWALVVGGFGVTLLLRQLDIIDINVFSLFWPAVIIVIGFSIIFNRSGGAKGVVESNKSDDFTAILGGIDHRSTSSSYKGGQVTAVMGGAKIDLRKAKIQDGATLHVFGFWGGIELIIPEGTVVQSRASCILGGIENKTSSAEVKGAPTLMITGDIVMAGVEIKN